MLSKVGWIGASNNRKRVSGGDGAWQLIMSWWGTSTVIGVMSVGHGSMPHSSELGCYLCRDPGVPGHLLTRLCLRYPFMPR